jgi:membrane associated rhomboid family serine protease
MRYAESRGSTTGWVIATLRWLWGADDEVGWRSLFESTPATWSLLALFCSVSILDMVLAHSIHVPGPVIERIGQSPAHEALGEWWRFFTTTLINAPEPHPQVNAVQHLIGNGVLFAFTAPRVERFIGSNKVVVLWFVATISGAVAIFVGAPFYWPPGGGSSHAAYAFLAGALVIGFVRRRRSRRDAIFFGAALIATASLAQQVPTYPTGTNVSHLAGFIVGCVLCAVWCARPAARRIGAGAAAAFVLVAGSLTTARASALRHSDLKVHSETPLGFAPVMVTPAFGSMWVTGGQATGVVERDQIVRIDPKTGRVSARIREPGAGGLPAVTQDRIWVPSKGSVVAIDPTRNRVVSRVGLANTAWPWSVAVTADALWAAVPDAGEVIRIDLHTQKERRIPVGARPYVVVAERSDVWATSYGGQMVYRLDPQTGAVVEQRSLPNAPYHVAYLNGSLWVGAEPFIYRLRPQSLEVISKIDTHGDTWTLSSDAGGHLLVPQRYSRSVVEIDSRTARVVRRIVVGLRQPTAVTVIGDDFLIADPFRESVMRASAAPGAS